MVNFQVIRPTEFLVDVLMKIHDLYHTILKFNKRYYFFFFTHIYLALMMNTRAKKNIKNLSFLAKYKSQIESITSKEHDSANKVWI